jgi:hypothetical protein
MNALLFLALLQAEPVVSSRLGAAGAALTLAIETSQWCGRKAIIAFSVVNTGTADEVFFIAPSRDLDDGSSSWRGGYSLALGREVSGRAVVCDANHGATCVSETNKVTLKPSGKKTWHVTGVEGWPKHERAQAGGLSIAFRPDVSDNDYANASRLSWSGKLKVSRVGVTKCWQLAAVEPGVAGGRPTPSQARSFGRR